MVCVVLYCIGTHARLALPQTKPAKSEFTSRSMPLSVPFYSHWAACKRKQQSRSAKIASLTRYHEALTENEVRILRTPIHQIPSSSYSPQEVLLAYGKATFLAHRETNCITECLYDGGELWAKAAKGPFKGIPVSLKDTVSVAGYDSCIAYSSRIGKPAVEDAPLVKLLVENGAVPYVKTNVPITMLSFEAYNDVFGVTTNIWNKDYTPGGSTGGESTLLAYGGSRIGIGTDVAGSVRVPAHFTGIYSIRCSTGRFPYSGNATAMPGQEGVPSVYSPMARTLLELEWFLKTLIDCKPWEYDHYVHPLPWRDVKLKKGKVGVIWTDGVCRPSPACTRALSLAVDAVRKRGYETVDMSMTQDDGLEALSLASKLLLADGGEVATRNFQYGEHNDAGVWNLTFAARLPGWLKWIWKLFIRDHVWKTLVQGWGKKSTAEFRALVYARENYRKKWLDRMNDADVEFVLTVPNATPALPHKGLAHSVSSCGYTFLFNLLDYTAGVIPVTTVEPSDAVLPDFRPANKVERGAFVNYDACKMAGLPVGVQVVGRRLDEERVLKAMHLVQDGLRDIGVVWKEIEGFSRV